MKKENKPVKAYKGFNKYMQCTPNGENFSVYIGTHFIDLYRDYLLLE